MGRGTFFIFYYVFSTFLTVSKATTEGDTETRKFLLILPPKYMIFFTHIEGNTFSRIYRTQEEIRNITTRQQKY